MEDQCHTLIVAQCLFLWLPTYHSIVCLLRVRQCAERRGGGLLLAGPTVDIPDQWLRLFGELLTRPTEGAPQTMPLSKLNSTFWGTSINISIPLYKPSDKLLQIFELGC